MEKFTVLSLSDLVDIQGGEKKKKYTGPNYRCMVKSGVGLVSGAIGGSPFGVDGIVGGGMAGLVGGAISCLNNK